MALPSAASTTSFAKCRLMRQVTGSGVSGDGNAKLSRRFRKTLDTDIQQLQNYVA